MSYAGVLLAGGKSRRMGRDKASLPWGPGTLLTHQAGVLTASGAAPLLLSAPREKWPELLSFVGVVDSQPGAGPALALADAWAQTSAAVLLALAIDVPKVPAEFLRRLADEALRSGKSVVPVRNGYFEPLIAAWHRSSVAALAAAANRPLQQVCVSLERNDQLTRWPVPEEQEFWFENVNTAADYARLHSRF